MSNGAADLVHVLEADPDLGRNLSPQAREQAVVLAVAPAQWIDPGQWTPTLDGDLPGHLGLLVLEGLMLRSARLVEQEGVEMLGPGDLLRPWQADHSAPFVPGDARWDVLERTRIAVLDRRFTTIAGRWPELVTALAERALRRSRGMALGLALAQIPKVEVRLLVLLWHVAESWGHREQDGWVIPVRLTHELLARLVFARRPTVSLAMKSLGDRGLMARRADGLLVLAGEPPNRLAALREAIG